MRRLAIALTILAIIVLVPQRAKAYEMAKDAITTYIQFRMDNRIID